MALVKCKECGREISDQAPTCPGCGAPMAVALGIPAAWVTPPTPPPVTQPPPTPPAAPQAPPPQYSAPTARSTSGCATAVMIVVGLLVLMLIIGRCSRPEPDTTGATKPASAPSAPVQTPEERQKLAANIALQMESASASPVARLGYAETLIRSYPGTPEAQRAAQLIDDLKVEVAEADRGKQWNYGESEDSMSSKTTYAATVTSTNTLELDFPYQGKQHATLTLRRHPRWGNDVMFSIEKGQILCSSYDCPIRVRFDDGPAQTFSGNEPSDNSSEYVFIPGFGSFAKKLEKAKKVKIEVNVYQHGVLVSEFDVDGFKPERLKASK